MPNLKSFEKEVEKREKVKKIKVGTQIFERLGHIVYVHQNNSQEKVIALEKLIRISKGEKELKEGDVEYRISYFNCIDSKNTKWKRSAFHPLIPDQDFIELFKEAKKDKDFYKDLTYREALLEAASSMNYFIDNLLSRLSRLL